MVKLKVAARSNVSKVLFTAVVVQSINSKLLLTVQLFRLVHFLHKITIILSFSFFMNINGGIA